MKIQCPNPKCRIKFKAEPGQKRCFYCDSKLDIKISKREYQKEIKKSQKEILKKIYRFLAFWLLTIGLFDAFFFYRKPGELDNTGFIFTSLVVITGILFFLFLVFLIFSFFNYKFSPLKAVLVSGTVSGILLIVGFALIFIPLMIHNKKYQAEKPKSELNFSKNNCDEKITIKMAKSCTFPIEGDRSSGSGFLIKENFIVTNKHVVEGNRKLTTSFSDGSTENLILWNYSEKDDIAILKINRPNLIPCEWADSNLIEEIETLYAIGFPGDAPPGESSIVRGIFSRKINTEEGAEFLQTDAPINPGNSGGPLVNKCGIVGINTAKIAWSTNYIPTEGLGFAISSNYAKPIVEELIKTGSEKKLPLKSSSIKKYSPKSGEKNNQSSYSTYDSSFISSWLKAKTWIDEANSYWQSVDSGKYDQAKLFELKDLLVRMKTITDTLVPKIQNHQPLSKEENDLLISFNNLQNKVIALEGELDGQNYTYGYYHYECRNGLCTKINGRGRNTCKTFYDCQPKYHYECKDMMCVQVEGDGKDECFISSDCYHYECQGKACVKVDGKGTNQCYYETTDSYSCKHNECKEGKCVEVEGPGINTCYSDYGCKI